MIAVALICLTVLALAERARPLLLRLIKLQEYIAAANARVPDEPTPSVPPLPLDLQDRVNHCTQDWERSDLQRAIVEHYLEARQLVQTDAEAWIAVRERLRPEIVA